MSTKSASGRLCTKVAKAKLISRLVLAFRTEALMMPDEVRVVLQLDGLAERERHRRRA